MLKNRICGIAVFRVHQHTKQFNFFTKKCQTVVCFRHVLFLELYLHLKFRKVTGRVGLVCELIMQSGSQRTSVNVMGEGGGGKAKITTLSQENINSLHHLDYHQKQTKLKAKQRFKTKEKQQINNNNNNNNLSNLG